MESFELLRVRPMGFHTTGCTLNRFLPLHPPFGHLQPMQILGIYDIAKRLLEHYGDDSLLMAMTTITKLHTLEDWDGVALWQEITEAIEWLLIPPDLTQETQH